MINVNDYIFMKIILIIVKKFGFLDKLGLQMTFIFVFLNISWFSCIIKEFSFITRSTNIPYLGGD